jgi:hypothetical protein
VSRQTIAAFESGGEGRVRVLLAVAKAMKVRVTLVADTRGVPTWFTPPHLLDALYSVFDIFDLDPCSPDPPTVKCRAYFTEADDGLRQAWHGAVYCNPPYEALPEWTAKMLKEFQSGRVHKLIGLVPAYLGTQAWRRIRSSGAAIFVLDSRLKFGGRSNTARFPSAIPVWGATDLELNRLAAALPANHRLLFEPQTGL